MASKQPSKANDYYPKREDFRTHEEWNAHIETLKQVYALRDLVQAHAEQIKAATSNIRDIQSQPQPGGPLSTMVGGFVLKPGQPANGNTIRYNAATGEFIFGA